MLAEIPCSEIVLDLERRVVSYWGNLMSDTWSLWGTEAVSDSGLYRSKGKMAIGVEWRQRALLPYFQSLMGKDLRFPLAYVGNSDSSWAFLKRTVRRVVTPTERGWLGTPLLRGAKGDSQMASQTEHHPCLGIVKWDSPLAKRETASIRPPAV